VTGLDLIKFSLRSAGVLADGEVPTASEAQDSLLIAQQMMDSWSADRLKVFSIQRTAQFPLTSGQQVYRVGTGGDFNIPRPAKLSRVGIINLGNPIQPLELPLEYLTYDEWAGIPVKNIQSALPLKVWDDQGFPYRNLSYWPVPNVQVQTVLYIWAVLSTFPDLTTDVEFPPGYFKALRYNLAVELCADFSMPVPQVVTELAAESRAIIEAMNALDIVMRCDPAVVNPKQQVYNWISDGYGRSFRG
jgi:hypothetical protein